MLPVGFLQLDRVVAREKLHIYARGRPSTGSRGKLYIYICIAATRYCYFAVVEEKDNLCVCVSERVCTNDAKAVNRSDVFCYEYTRLYIRVRSYISSSDLNGGPETRSIISREGTSYRRRCDLSGLNAENRTARLFYTPEHVYIYIYIDVTLNAYTAEGELLYRVP